MRPMKGMCSTVGTKSQMNQLYVTALRKLAKTYNYGSLADSLFCDRMVAGINDNSACKELLQTSKLTLGQCIGICRSSQTSARQLKEMNQEDVRFVKDDRRKTGHKKKTKGFNLYCNYFIL